MLIVFQSTRPSRASTKSGRRIWKSSNHFNPQGPHGPRLNSPESSRYIHSFQSTRPSRASTKKVAFQSELFYISIHKALTGLDTAWLKPPQYKQHFNPQGPHGPRRNNNKATIEDVIFQSTRPSRASTVNYYKQMERYHISIHKALTGLDYGPSSDGIYHFKFQSTRPSRASTLKFF